MNAMYAKHDIHPGRPFPSVNLAVRREQQMTEERIIRALNRALHIAKPEAPGLEALVPMAEGHLDPAGIHVVWIFDCRKNLARALEGGVGRLLYQLTATALREARMQVERIGVNVHFDTEQDCLELSHGNWESRLSLLHYPARRLESDITASHSTDAVADRHT